MALFSNRTRLLLYESWALSWPMTLIMFFDFLIGLTDVFVAGRIAKEIQAAYGIAYQVYFIFFTIALAFTTGTVSLVSRLFTSTKQEEYCTTVYSSLVSTLVFGLAFGVICLFAGPLVVASLRIPGAVKLYAVPMIRVYSAALVFDYLLLNSNGILRSSNRIIVSLRTMAVVALLNIVLNFVLAFRTPLGYLGIAVSSTLSLAIGVALNSFPVRRLLAGAKAFSMCAVREMIGIGWPMALQSFLWQASSMAIYTILGRLPYDPVETMAAFTNGLRIESAIFLPVFAFNMANAVIVGNLIGKKRIEDAYHNGIITAWLGVAIVFVLTALVILFAPLIMPMVSPSHGVIQAGITYLRIAFLIEPVFAWGIILSGGLSGAGDTKRIMAITGVSLWAVRIPLAFLLGLRLGFGPVGVWWAMNASILTQTILFSRRYFSRKWLETAEKALS